MWRLNFSALGREKQLYLDNMGAEEQEIFDCLTHWRLKKDSATQSWVNFSHKIRHSVVSSVFKIVCLSVIYTTTRSS